MRAAGLSDPSRISYTVENGGAYFYNVRRILAYSAQCVVLAGKKGKLTVEGEALSLHSYSAGDLTVKGDIACVRSE